MSDSRAGKSAAARDAVLGRIRAALTTAASTDEARRASVAARLRRRAAHLIPARANAPPKALKEMLRGFLEGQSATVVEVSALHDIPTALANYLRARNLPLRVRLGNDPLLAGLDWSREPALERCPGAADPGDEVSLSHAAAAVAETGTLLLAAGPANPVTLSFLPEAHVVVLAAKDIVGHYEAAFDRVRAVFGQGNMPRTVNLISGPSRTADVGGRLVTGAHGPRRLCVIIFDDRA